MDVTITAETGRPTGTRNSKRLRAEGKVPGVVYGLGSEPMPVAVEWTELRRALTTEAGTNALISITVDGETRLSIVKEFQRHPVKRNVTHVDFLVIDPDAPVAVDVPIVLHGESEQVERMKGMVEQLIFTLTVKAKPGNFPTQLEADTSGLDIGTQLKVGDIVLPDGVTTDANLDEAVAQGAPTRSTIILQQEAARAERAALGIEEIEGEGGTSDDI